MSSAADCRVELEVEVDGGTVDVEGLDELEVVVVLVGVDGSSVTVTVTGGSLALETLGSALDAAGSDVPGVAEPGTSSPQPASSNVAAITNDAVLMARDLIGLPRTSTRRSAKTTAASGGTGASAPVAGSRFVAVRGHRPHHVTDPDDAGSGGHALVSAVTVVEIDQRLPDVVTHDRRGRQPEAEPAELHTRVGDMDPGQLDPADRTAARSSPATVSARPG